MEQKKLTEHFYLREFTDSDIALRNGIPNKPSPLVLEHLQLTANGMEEVRTVLDKPIFINSGYRSPKLNAFIGGSKTSDHKDGYAADFVCRSFGTPEQIVDAILKSGIKFDQLICEGNWVHISFNPRLRMQALRALFDEKGGVTYRKFV